VLSSKLLKSLHAVTRDKQNLTEKARRLEQTEQQLMDQLSRALTPVGYRVVSLRTAGSAASARAGRRAGGTLPKRLRCPKCDRRFSHPLPMARHVAATHSVKPAARKNRLKAKRSA
jgi:uncharacterized C2H2 Zn-finger protein